MAGCRGGCAGPRLPVPGGAASPESRPGRVGLPGSVRAAAAVTGRRCRRWRWKVPVPSGYVLPHGALCLVRGLDLDPEAGRFGSSKEVKVNRYHVRSGRDWWPGNGAASVGPGVGPAASHKKCV